jgi:hypothetical protein
VADAALDAATVADAALDAATGGDAAPSDAGLVDAATAADATPSDAGAAEAGVPDAGNCQANGLMTCAVATCDDGTSAASSLRAGSLRCIAARVGNVGRNWADAMSYCPGLGAGFRLATKGEALKIASSPSVCIEPLPGGWRTWTSSCAGAGRAWLVNTSTGNTSQGNVDVYLNLQNDVTLCVL